MTKAERDELAKLLRARAKVAKDRIDQRKSELLAQAEEQLSALYPAHDARWRDLAREAEHGVTELDAQLAARCQALGIAPEFRPHLACYWHTRGENAATARRSELRKVAAARVAALATSARVAIETAALDGLTQLAGGALESDEARAFLAAMPSVTQLMPALELPSLATALTVGSPGRWQGSLPRASEAEPHKHAMSDETREP